MRLWRCPRASSARAESTVRARLAHLRDFQSDPVNNLGCLAGSHKPANLGGGGSRRASSAPAKPAKAPAKKSTPKAPVQPQVRAKHCQYVDHHSSDALFGGGGLRSHTRSS